MDFLSHHFSASIDALTAAAEDATFIGSLHAASAACAKSLRAGGKLLIAGNGGSAADAQHIAGEFLSRMNYDRAPLAAVALTADSSVLTAVGNDYGFEYVFERQVRGLARPGDVFIAISTSGRSPNVIRAISAAREAGAVVIGIGGAHGAMKADCDIYLGAPSTSTPLIQQIYLVAAHALCGAVEKELFPPHDD